MSGGRLATWRVAARIARRDARRHLGRTALVLLLVGAPVAAVTWGDVVLRSSQLDPRDEVTVRLGAALQAELEVVAPGGTVAQNAEATVTSSSGSTSPEDVDVRPALDQALPRGDRLLLRRDWTGPRLEADGRRLPVDSYVEVPLGDPALAGLATAGVVPRAGQVLVSQRLADAGLRPGAQVVVPGSPVTGRPARTLTVAGTVRGWWADRGSLVVGPPGTLVPPEATRSFRAYRDWLPPQGSTWYVAGPVPVRWADVQRFNARGVVVRSRAVLLDPPSPSELAPEVRDAGPAWLSASDSTIVVVAVGMVVLQVALLAGPAFAVGAQRNRYALAQLAASGATPRQVRAVVLVNGLVLGGLAAVAGAVLGTLAAAALVTRTDLVDGGVPRVDVHLLDLALLVALGTLAGVVASLPPARAASRLDIVATLAGRRGEAPPHRRVPVAGLALTGLGLVLLVVGAFGRHQLVLVLGLAIGEVGLVTTTGAVTALAARAASGLASPVARIALRDAARRRSRTAPAVAAVMAAIAAGTAVLLFAAYRDATERARYVPSAAPGAVLVQGQAAPRVAAGLDWSALEAGLRQRLPVDRVVVSRSGLAPGDTPGWVHDIVPPERQCPTDLSPEQTRSDPRCGTSLQTSVGASVPGVLVDDDGSALAILLPVRDRVAEAALAAGRVVVPDRQAIDADGTALLVVSTPEGEGQPGGGRTVRWPATAATTAIVLDAPVLPAAAARALGLDVVRTGLLATTTRTPTPDEVAAATAGLITDDGLGEVLNLQAETGYPGLPSAFLAALVGAAAFVALVGTVTAVGLAAAEARPDLATLGAVGASPGTRRRLAGAQAAVVSGLGVLLGTAAGFAAGYALVVLDRSGSASGLDVPWPALLTLVVGTPLVAVLITAAATRSRLELVRLPGR